ncbi:TIR domain-containing protein [Chloroflexota bacterium]
MAKKQKTIIDEIDEFRTCLIGFTVLRKKIIQDKKLTSEEDELFPSLFNEISIDAGKHGPLIKEITGLETIHTSAGPQYIWNWALSSEANTLVINALDNCISAASRTIGTLKKDIDNGLRDKKTGNIITEKKPPISAEKPKAFIAHEGMTKALQKLKDFLDDLGVDYLIAERQPSNGRVVERQVQWAQGQTDFAIILATKGKAVNRKTGEPYMGLNVADKLGRAREVYKNRIILLLQKGADPHTNTSGIVREDFTPQNMEKAFGKIVRELRNWRLI